MGTHSQSQQLRLVSLNVDGCGHNSTSPAYRIDALLTMILARKPDIIVLQEVTVEMQAVFLCRMGKERHILDPKWPGDPRA